MFRKKLYYSVLIPAVLLAFRPVWAAEIHVSTWDELKSAVENGIDGAGAGGTVYLDKNIVAPNDYAATITTAVPGIVIDGQGNTISSGRFPRKLFDFSSSAQTDLQIKNVVFDFGNDDSDYGNNIIKNKGKITSINADFLNNGYRDITSGNESDGAAINNTGNIDYVSGTFKNNHTGVTSAYMRADGKGRGGAIFNEGTINIYDSNFSNNYIYNFLSNRENFQDMLGGAIYNSGVMNITNSSFYDNYIQDNLGGTAIIAE